MTVTGTVLDRLELQLGALVERGRAGRGFSADEARAWTDRGPVAFGTERLGSSYWSRQLDVLERVWRNPRVAVRSANSMGKNFVTADFMAWWIFAKGGAVLYTAPTDRQLDIGMKELRRALHGSDLPYELFHRSLRVRGETRLFAFTSNSADSLRGFHDPRGLLVVIDEGQGKSVEAVAFDAAFSCATGEGDKILVLGNPAHTGGKFHAISKAGNWCALKIAAHEHPNISGQRVVIAGGPAPDWPEQIAAEYGRESPFYTAFVDGEFPTEGTIDSLLEAAWVDASFDRHDAGPGLTPYPLPVAALDVARSVAGDESVCAIAQGARVDSLTAWRSRDLVDTASRFTLIADRIRLELFAQRQRSSVATTSPVWSDAVALHEWCSQSGARSFTLIVDAPGVGGGCIDPLRARGRIVKEFWGWNPSSDKKRFANVRAETYWILRKVLEDGRAQLPRDAMLREELLGMEYSLDGKGRIAMLDKESLRKVLGRSPDRCDAVTMALAESTGSIRGPTITFATVDA